MKISGIIWFDFLYETIWEAECQTQTFYTMYLEENKTP